MSARRGLNIISVITLVCVCYSFKTLVQTLHAKHKAHQEVGESSSSVVSKPSQMCGGRSDKFCGRQENLIPDKMCADVPTIKFPGCGIGELLNPIFQVDKCK